MGDKISVLSALCISQVDPLWNNIFFINWAKGSICSLGYWSFDGKMLGAHYIPSGSIQEKVTSDPQEAGGRRERYEDERCLLQRLGLGLQSRAHTLALTAKSPCENADF